MEKVVILFAGNKAPHMFAECFESNGKKVCAVEKALDWALSVKGNSFTAFLVSPENEQKISEIIKSRSLSQSECAFYTFENPNPVTAELLQKIASVAEEKKASEIIYARASCPFLDTAITEKLVSIHEEFRAEYTFADGYPFGFAPEIIDSGASSILASLSSSVSKKAGDMPCSKDSIFSVMKGDINSFEIETLIAPKDYRMLRLDFSCETYSGYKSCVALSAACTGKEIAFPENAKSESGDENVLALSDIAEKNISIIKTVPAFYNIQIEAGCTQKYPFSPYPDFFEKKFGNMEKSGRRMKFGEFAPLVKKISDFSEAAVVSLSLFDEAVLNPEFVSFVKEILSYEGLCAMIEVSGAALCKLSESGVIEKISGLLSDPSISRKSKVDGCPRILWILSLDAFTKEKYAELYEGAKLDQAVCTVKKLSDLFNKENDSQLSAAYVQFTRFNANEDELEQFYRFWKESDSPAAGNLVIQKHDCFAGLIPSEKTADLSPVLRNPCWHIRRDFDILFDGSVVMCRELSFENAIGNAFTEELCDIWERKNELVQKHIENNYPEKCGKCDEYYTFNF